MSTKQTIEHKGYIGTVEVDTDDDTLFGKVVNVDGSIMYEGNTVAELRQTMAGMVDAYLELCEEAGTDPRKPYSGRIALRVDPDLHARIAATADSRGDSMNNVIVWAITSALGADDEVASATGSRGSQQSDIKRAGTG